MPIYSGIPYIGPPRSYGGKYTKYFIVVHSTENTAPARNEASYAKNRTDGTSSHYYVDDTEIIQSLNTDYGANHVGSWQGNQRGISYEFVGRASWSRAKWLDSIDFEAAAAQMARDCQTWGIPVRRLSVAQLADMEKGITTHNDCRRAFGGTDHTDPGSNFPMDRLIELITGGDEMELQDIKDLAYTDNVFPAPKVDSLGVEMTDEEYAQNPYWKLSGILQQTSEDVRRARGETRTLGEETDARLSTIEAKIDALSAPAAPELTPEQLEALAESVADRLRSLTFVAEEPAE